MPVLSFPRCGSMVSNMLRKAAIILALAVASPAHADAASVRERVIAELRDDGYTEVRISRTLLGRLRFVARRSDAVREIVVNPSTGVILRDYMRFLSETGTSSSSGAGGVGGGSSQNGSEEDDDYDDGSDDDESDDDYDDEHDESDEDYDEPDDDESDDDESDDPDESDDNSGSGSSNSGSGSDSSNSGSGSDDD